MPVIAKGIMCREDARLALEAGVDALYVSNHGSRQLDTTPSTLEVLNEISSEATLFSIKHKTPKVEILFDGGIRRGADVLKAVALGADSVWIGRPVIWGLSCNGQTGVEQVLKILNQELKEAMLQCGCYSLQDVRNKGLIYGP